MWYGLDCIMVEEGAIFVLGRLVSLWPSAILPNSVAIALVCDLCQCVSTYFLIELVSPFSVQSTGNAKYPSGGVSVLTSVGII